MIGVIDFEAAFFQMLRLNIALVNRRDDEICSHEFYDRAPYRPKSRTPSSAAMD
jgi:hypothetical protein